MSIAELVEQARTLSIQERKQLVKALIDTLDAPEEVKLHRITELRGLGTAKPHSILEFEGIAAHLADAEDPQEYVNRLRDEWDQS